MDVQDKELLGYIHQNARMGTDTIAQMVRMTNDIPFRRALESQQQDYQAIVDEAQLLGQQIGQPVDKGSETAGAAGAAMRKLGLLKNDSVQNMAKMLVKGSTDGVIEITRHRKECQRVDAKVDALAERLLQAEQSNIDQMKQYL